MITAHAQDISDVERRVRELRAEIARLRAKRRELSQRIASSQGRGHANRKNRSAGTQRAVHVLEVERDQVDERIAVLEAAARSIQDYSRQPAGASTSPGLPVDPNATQTSQAQGAVPMVRTSWFANSGIYRKWATIPRLAQSRLIWTIGNALMLVGIVLLLYVGGIYSQAEYDRYAARGDTDLPAPQVIARPPDAAAAAPYQPAPFTAPDLSTSSYTEGPVRSAVPDAAHAAHKSTITRVVVPSVGVDSKVVEVGWDVVEQNGQQMAVWQVAEYAVGQHRGSANPGEGDNVVLAGHVGGYGKVFKNLFYINPGDQITLYSGGQQYLYTVQERLILTEEGVSPEQQAANAQYIAPTGTEVVTLVTCWPPKGADKFTERIVVRAVPFGAGAAPQTSQSRWTIR
jgi:sortase (surface protein transpeptidase)